MCSFADAVETLLKKEHNIDFSGVASALKRNWTTGQQESEDLAILAKSVFLCIEVQNRIAIVQKLINEALSVYDIVIPDFVVDVKAFPSAIKDEGSDPKNNSRGPAQPTPAWTGLRLRRTQAAVAASQTSAINIHGGVSSNLKRNKNTKVKPAGVSRDASGK